MADKNFKVKNGADIGGTVTATAFVGSGAGLTNISSYSVPTLGSTSIASGATVTTIAGLTLSSPTISGSLTAGGGTGTNGQVLQSTGTGVQWGTVSGYSAPTIGSTSIASGATVTEIAGLTLTSPIVNNLRLGYTTTATANSTLTLTSSSNEQQFFTGNNNHTVILPVASTMTLGQKFIINNTGTLGITVQSSGGNLIATVAPYQIAEFVCIITSGTAASSWKYNLTGFSGYTGQGQKVVLETYPTLTGPNFTGSITYNGSTGAAGSFLSYNGWQPGVSGNTTVFGEGAYRPAGTPHVIIGSYANSGGHPDNQPTVAIGTYAAAGITNYSYSGVAVGAYAANSSPGNNYTAIGAFAGAYGSSGTMNGDVFIGSYSGVSYSRSGNQNTVIGYYAGSQLTSGSNNTIIGHEAGKFGDAYSGGIQGVQSGSNNIVLGYQSRPSSNSVSNQITLGNPSITSLRCQVTSISGLSDERDKTNIQDLPIGIDFVNSLRPVKFEWNTRDESKVGIEDFGFIAQEVMEAEDSIDAHEWLSLTLRDNEERYELAPAKLVPILVKAIQDLSEEIKSLKNNNNLN